MMTNGAMVINGVFENQFEFQPPFPSFYSRSTVRTPYWIFFHRYLSIFISMNLSSNLSNPTILWVGVCSLQYSTNSSKICLYACSYVAPILPPPFLVCPFSYCIFSLLVIFSFLTPFGFFPKISAQN